MCCIRYIIRIYPLFVPNLPFLAESRAQIALVEIQFIAVSDQMPATTDTVFRQVYPRQNDGEYRPSSLILHCLLLIQRCNSIAESGTLSSSMKPSGGKRHLSVLDKELTHSFRDKSSQRLPHSSSCYCHELTSMRVGFPPDRHLTLYSPTGD